MEALAVLILWGMVLEVARWAAWILGGTCAVIGFGFLLAALAGHLRDRCKPVPVDSSDPLEPTRG